MRRTRRRGRRESRRAFAEASLRRDARHDVVVEAHAKPQRFETDALVVSVDAAGIALGERERPQAVAGDAHAPEVMAIGESREHQRRDEDRKSTRLNSSHSQISYAVFCLKKKN